LNISNKKFPIRKCGKNLNILELDIYKIYELNKHEIEKYLNIWYQGIKKDCQHCNHFITCKRVDQETAATLYNKKINPIETYIYSYKDLQWLKFSIRSIDDGTYTIEIKDELKNLKIIQTKIMQYISNIKIINGEEFLNYCKQFVTDFNIDYD